MRSFVFGGGAAAMCHGCLPSPLGRDLPGRRRMEGARIQETGLLLQEGFMRALPLFCSLTLLILLFAGLPARAGYQRWAVITSGSPEESQFSDLLLAALTEVPELELVERAELEKLSHEQELSGAFSAEGSADRLKIGRMLRADALVLAKIGGPAEGRELELIVAECNCGARLDRQTLPWSADDLPALVRYTAGQVTDIRTRFANGISRVYGVPSFTSQSLSRDYDPLQSSYARLIAGVLALQPGTAVIETGEARALGRELALGGNAELQRLVPAFVAGEFRVEPQPGGEALVTLKVSVTGGTHEPIVMNSAAMPLSDAGKWLAMTAAPKILATADEAGLLTVEAQVAALTARADIFSQLGAPEEANGLREAALLLAPDASDLRESAFKDYCRIAQYDRACAFPGLPKNDDAQKIAFLDGRVTAYEAALDHAALLIGSGALREADEFALLDTLKDARYSFQVSWNDFGGYVVRTPAAAQRVSDTCFATLRFYEQVEALVLPRMDPRQFWQAWMPKLDKLLEMYPSLSTADEYQAYYAFSLRLLEKLPDDLDYIVAPHYFWSAPEEPLQAYCKALSESPKRTEHLQAQFITLCRRFKLLNNKQTHGTFDQDDLESATVLEQEMERLIADYQEFVFPDPAQIPVQSRGLGLLKVYQRFICSLGKTNTRPVVTAVKAPTTFDAVSFQKIEIKIIDGPAITQPRQQHVDIYTCTDTLEYVKTDYHLYLHERPGELRHLRGITGTSPKMQFGDLAWDGERLWAVVNTVGLWVMAPDGQLLGSVTRDHGLPEADTVLLQPLADGSIFAVGSFGEERRAWCAVLQWQAEKKATVKLVYEPRRPLSPTEPFENPAILLDPAVGFMPTSIAPVTNAAGHPALLIGRYHQNCHSKYTGKWADLRPLLLDLETFQAEVADVILTSEDPHHSFLQAGNDLYLFSRLVEPRLSGPMKADSAGKAAVQPIPMANPGGPDPDDFIASPEAVNFLGYPKIETRVMLPGTDGWIYVPGIQWQRFNTATGLGQRLTGWLPPHSILISGRFLRSNLLGLLNWHESGVYKVVIDETKIPAAQ